MGLSVTGATVAVGVGNTVGVSVLIITEVEVGLDVGRVRGT